jgi:hypothetical protein
MRDHDLPPQPPRARALPVPRCRWQKLGRVEPTQWIANGGGPPLPDGDGCRFPDCGLEAEGEAGLCVHHRNRWIRAERPPLKSGLLGCATFGRDRFDLRRLPMRLEIAYAIQRRADERRTITRPHGRAVMVYRSWQDSSRSATSSRSSKSSGVRALRCTVEK